MSKKVKYSSIKGAASADNMMTLDLVYEGKRYRFNMYEELTIKEVSLDSTIKAHPSNYYFLLTLRTNLDANKKALEAKKKRVWNKAYKLAKSLKGDNGRPYSDDLSKASAEISPGYKKASADLIEAERAYTMVHNAVIAFQERKDLIQTLSANKRKDR